MQILLALLERLGQIVIWEELRKRLWSDDKFVDFDRRLNNAANRLGLHLAIQRKIRASCKTGADTGYRSGPGLCRRGT
jgi:hypothetical protein